MKFKEYHGEVDVVDDYDETHVKEPPKANLNPHTTNFFYRDQFRALGYSNSRIIEESKWRREILWARKLILKLY